MTFELGPANLPDLLAGIGMLAIAALLLWVAPNDRLHRAFALFQVVNAGGSLAYAAQLGFADADPEMSVVFLHVGAYYVLALAFAAAFFALRFLDPEGRSRVSRPLAWALLISAAGVLGAFALDHDLVNGPFGLAWLQIPLTFGVLGFIFATSARRAQTAKRRGGLLLASLAFALVAAYWSGLGIATFLFVPERALGLDGDGLRSGPIMVAMAVSAPWLGAFAVVATVFLASSIARGPQKASLRPSSRTFATGTAAAALVGAAIASLLWLDAERYALLPFALDGVARVAMTVMLAYALLKRQLFDAEVKLRFAISRSTVAAAFVAAFFLASEGAQILFGQESQFVGLIAAGALVFALAPLQRAAERLAEKAVPIAGTAAPADSAPRPSPANAFRSAVRVARHDGLVTPDEERHLAEVADALGLTHAEAARVRREVEEEHAS